MFPQARAHVGAIEHANAKWRLVVKGSQVQILSARLKKYQVRGHFLALEDVVMGLGGVLMSVLTRLVE